MAWKFRKRIKIVPGVTINLSRSGVSTTIGTKGGSVPFSVSAAISPKPVSFGYRCKVS